MDPIFKIIDYMLKYRQYVWKKKVAGKDRKNEVCDDG